MDLRRRFSNHFTMTSRDMHSAGRWVASPLTTTLSVITTGPLTASLHDGSHRPRRECKGDVQRSRFGRLVVRSVCQHWMEDAVAHSVRVDPLGVARCGAHSSQFCASAQHHVPHPSGAPVIRPCVFRARHYCTGADRIRQDGRLCVAHPCRAAEESAAALRCSGA